MRTKHRDMLENIMAEAERKKLQVQLLVAANENNDGETDGYSRAVQRPTKNVLEDAALAESVCNLSPMPNVYFISRCNFNLSISYVFSRFESFLLCWLMKPHFETLVGQMHQLMSCWMQ